MTANRRPAEVAATPAATGRVNRLELRQYNCRAHHKYPKAGTCVGHSGRAMGGRPDLRRTTGWQPRSRLPEIIDTKPRGTSGQEPPSREHQVLRLCCVS